MLTYPLVSPIFFLTMLVNQTSSGTFTSHRVRRIRSFRSRHIF